MADRTGSGYAGLKFSKDKQTARAPKAVASERPRAGLKRTAMKRVTEKKPPGPTARRQAKRTRLQERTYQKNKRNAAARDERLIRQNGASGLCRCGCGAVEVNTHHWRKRGMGGGSRDDTVGNLVTLDWKTCHPRADSGELAIEHLDKTKRTSGPLRFTLGERSWTA